MSIAVIDRARRYLASMPPAISGDSGHAATFAAACALIHGFALSEDEAIALLASDYNPRCEPPWLDKELRHKVQSAAEAQHDKPRGHLLCDARHSASPPRSDPEPDGLTLARYAEAKCLPTAFLADLGLSDSIWRGKPAVRIDYGGGSFRHRVRMEKGPNGEERFANPSGVSLGLYCPRELPSGPAVLVEGESDVQSLLYAGMAAVGLPGAQTIGKVDLSMLSDRELFVVDESDGGARHLLGKLKGMPIAARTRVLRLGAYKDPSDAFLDMDADPERLATVMRSAMEKAPPLASWEEPKETATEDRPRLAFTWFKDTVERKPDWLWPCYLLREAAHVVGGKQGTSKGLFTVDLAARLTRGDCMPDGTGGGTPGRVLFVTREDSPEMALLPRLRVARADTSMVAWTHGDFEDGTPIATMAAGVAAIERAVIEQKIDLVIIDPLGAWVEDDMNNGQQVRAVIDPMSRIARKTKCAVLFVAHLRKSPADDPMDAFSGSGQVTAAVRVAIHIAPSGNGAERLVQVAKTNFRPPLAPMVYRLAKASMDDEDPPVLEWRTASGEDVAAAVASKNGSAPIVPIDEVYPLLAAEHRPFDEVARAAHKALLTKFRGLTVQGVKDAIAGLLARGRAYEGRGAHGVRTVGVTPAPVVETVTDKAVVYWEQHPQATVREVADAVGCSRTQAHRAQRMALSHSPVPSVNPEQGDNGTEPGDKAAKSCPSPVPLPYRGRAGRDGTRSESRGERLSRVPSPDEDAFARVEGAAP